MKSLYVLAGRLPRPMLTLALVLVFLADALGQVATYTANGTYTVPAGVSQITVECWGGGGRGGTRQGSNGAAGGGGGGAYSRSVLSVTGGQVFTVNVGAGSNSGTSPGGDSWFGTATTVMAKGGGSVANNTTTGASGGSAAASVGSVRFSGGNGANSNLSGGGGGSSAGTAANGGNGAVPAGGTAPAGGGNGGNGRSTSQGDGQDGSEPGGGGGGALRTSSGTRDGGSGGDGRVVVSFDPNGICMAALALNAIPDEACGTDELVAPIAISGLPTTLGTAAGNARLLSVELIISHPYRGDLNVTLTSPSGVTRNLWINRSTSGDNIGNPASCPNGALVFQDGGTALSTIGNTANSPTGTYAPEQTLAGFTGDPNGVWVLSVCDDGADDLGNLRYVRLNFCTVPQITATSSNSPACSSGSLNLGVTATGTAPLTYAWSGTGTFSPGPSSQNPTVTGMATGNYTIGVSNVCGSTNATIPVTVTPAPSATISYAGSPYCSNAGTVSVTRTGTAGGTYTSTPGLSINSGTGAVDLGASTPGTYTVTYTIAASAGCALFQTTASIIVTAAPSATISYAGSPYCSNAGTASVTRTGTAGGTYTSTAGLSINSGSGAVDLGASTPGTYTVTYTIVASGGCALFQTTASITVTAAPSATISYAGSPYCSNAGTASVTLTGAAGGTYTSTSGLSINSGTGAVDLGASTPGTYTVTYTIAASGGCALFQTTASITVAPAPSASISYAGSPYCSASGPAAVSLTGTTGGAFSATPAGLSINATTGEVDPGASTPGTYTVNYDIAAAGGCGAFNTSTSITITGCTYYSQGNGGVNSAIWATTPVGTPVAVTWNSTSSMVIQGGDTITVNANTAIDDLTAQATGRLIITAGHALTVHGDQVNLAQFTVSPLAGEVRLVSASTVSMAVTGTVNFNDLTVTTSAGTTVSGGVGIFGTLQLNAGAFNASGATVQLRSDATRTGRLGPVDPSASYTGDLTVQRFIPGGATNWRLLGSPVAGETVNDWKDDFFTAGFPGSHYPNFYDPPGSGIHWPSVRKYDETVADASMNVGLIGVTGTAEALATGRGYAVWSGDNLGGTNPFLVDVTGAPNVANTPIALPITWTNSGNPGADGYNLVSNPLPSPIDFASISRGADVQNFYWIYNPANGNNATWNGLVGTNGANGIIQSSQGFWLKADGPAVTTTVSETAKVGGNTGGVFGGSEDGPMPMVRLHLASTVNNYSDETVVVFAEGTPAYEEGDVAKFVFSHPAAPQIATRSSDDHNLAISMYGEFAEAISIPVLVNVAVNGTYTVTATQLEGVAGMSCLSIEDLQTGTITPLTEGATYSFVVLANDDETEPRLLLHATAPLQRTLVPVTCHGADDGQATVSLPGVTSAPVTWMTAGGQVVAEGALSNGAASITGLQPGNYSVSIDMGGTCAAIVNDFTITEPFALEVQANVVDASCPGQSDGQIAVEVLGGTAPHAFTWSTGQVENSIQVGAGSYSLTVTDSNGCTTEQTYTVASAPAPEVGITVDQPLVLLGSAIQFGTSVADYDEVQWDFGDGNTDNGPEVAHTYMAPGTYTVTQTILFGACSNSTTTEVVVELTTGVEAAQQADINAWVEGDHIVIMHPDDTRQVRYELRDAAGRLVMDHAATGSTGRVLVPAQGLATGVWVLTVRADQVVRTFRLPVVR